MNPAINPLVSIFSTNSTLLINSFNGVTEDLSLKRPNKRTNSMMFVFLHTVDARYFILKNLGAKIKNPFGKYVDWANTIEDIIEYPALGKVLKDWKKLHKILTDKLSLLSSKEIGTELDMAFPGGKKILDMIAFMAEHEAYHVGQLAYIRKFIGLKSVTF